MSVGTILITGGSGFVGFRILQHALQAGWHVRATVRSSEKADSIRRNPTIEALATTPSNLAFTIVDDITRPDAYDEAVRGVDYIIHVASPTVNATNFAEAITDEVFEEDFQVPAVRGTITILESARKEASVRRVIITSSIVALMPPEVYCGLERPVQGTVYSARTRMQIPPLPYPNRLFAYCVSKIAALNASDAWIAKEKPHFSVVNIHPGLVFGRNDLVRKPDDAMSGTNALSLSLALGAKREFLLCGSTVHVDDVARAHVEALDEAKITVDGSRCFVLTTTASYDEIPHLVANEYKQFVEKGVLRDDGLQPTNNVVFDTRETEETLGFECQPLVDQMRSLIGQYIELVEAA